MAKLLFAYNRTVLGNEGPYDNKANDPGGETIFGITRKYQSTWPGWKIFDDWAGPVPGARSLAAIVAFVTTDEAMQCEIKWFYERGPWAAVRGFEIEDQAVAEELFDSAINCGLVTVVKWLQRSLNIFNRGGTDYPDIEVDGYFGNQTLECLNALLKRRGPGLILKALNALQGVNYMSIAEKNPALEDFEAGWWIRRID